MAGLVTLLLALLEVFNEKLKTSEAKGRTRHKPCLLTDDERKQANEAKERTLRILSDALKKKGSLLVEDPKEFGDRRMKYNYSYSFITTDLVKELIRELEKVTFTKNTNPEDDNKTNAYVYPGSEDRTIYLCALFWKKDPESKSRQSTIIHEVSHFLGYGHTVKENSDKVQKSPQSMLCPLTTYKVAYRLTSFMDHPGTFTNGSYSCCGETSKDTVCEESSMADKLRLMRKVVQKDTAGDETDSSCDDTEWSDEDTDTSDKETFISGAKINNTGEESDTSSVETEASLEDMDTSDEEADDAAQQTNITVQKVKRRTALGKINTDMPKELTNLLKAQTKLINTQTRVLNAQINLLKGTDQTIERINQTIERRDQTIKRRDQTIKQIDQIIERTDNY